MNSRMRKLYAGVVLIFFVAACGGSGGGAKVVAKEAPGWIDDARTFLSSSHVGSDFSELTTTGSRSKVSTLIDEAPKQSLTSEQSQALVSLRAMRDFYAAVDDAGSLAASRYVSAATAVPTIADESARVSLVPSAHDRLVEHGNDLLKDITCDVAWGMMKPDEQTTVTEQVTTNGYARSVPQEVPGLESMTRAAAISAIESAAQANFLKLFARADVVDWYLYATGLFDKAAEVTGDGSMVITAPDGSLTHALVYYAKLCLVPPQIK